MKMGKTGSILAIFLIASLFLSISVVCGNSIQSKDRCLVNAKLNEQVDHLEVAPGETIEVFISYLIWSGEACPERHHRILVGLDDEPLYFFYDGVPGIHPGINTYDSREITAPTNPGTYTLSWMRTCELSRHDAENTYRWYPSVREKMATITVTNSDNLGTYSKVSNVNLNAQGDYLEIESGGAIEISLDYEIWNRIGCPGCIRQIVIGLNRDPLYCAYDGIPGIHPGEKGNSLLVMTAPTEPGTYIVRCVETAMYTCNDAKDKYRESDYLGYTIGTIKVTDSGSVTHGHHCEVTTISLNGQYDYLEVEPGETIKITVYYDLWNSDNCPNCKQQIVIGLEDNPMYCAYNGVPGIYPGVSDHDQVFYEMTAPTEPGIYHIMWINALEYTCHNAKTAYREKPSARKKIGTIKVTGDGSKEWELIHYKFVDVPIDYLDTIILFYQRGNDLRVQIDCVDPQESIIDSGSISLSVNESIYIHYYTGNASSKSNHEETYEAIKPRITLAHKTIMVLAGFIPGVGPTLAVIGYADDTSEYTVHWYVEKDCTGDIMVDPRMFFEWTEIQNWRDTVIIPWHQELPLKRSNSIRVNCPKMVFPKAGTYNMVFRVEYDIGTLLAPKARVRYDVALPITVA
jgi:hypothetical protein